MEMTIRLHKNQVTVFRSTSRFKVLATGRRFGKTVLACITLFVNCLKTKNGLYWYVSPTYKQTKQNAWKILLRMIPNAVLAKKPNETELSFQFKNGCELVLKGADNPDSLRGSGLDGLVVDEVSSIRNAKSVWEEVLRPALTDKLGWCFFIGTPKGKNYFWQLWMKGQKRLNGFESWSFKTEDNPYIPRSEIKEAKAELNERYFRQEYEASFEDFTGLIWPEFSEDKHVCDPFTIPSHWEKVGIIDPALTGTTAALLLAIDEDGNIFVIDEYYDQNVRVSEVSDKIKGWEPNKWLIDPSAAKKETTREGKLYSFADEYRDNGIATGPGENDVDAGINRVAEYLIKNKVTIFRNCKNLVEEINVYHWSDEKETSTGLLKPKPFKSFDHACDCLRYGIMGRPVSAMVQKVTSKDHAMPLAIELIEDPEQKTEYERWMS